MHTDLSNGAAWMRGHIIPIEDAKIGVIDWGLTHSDMVYDVVPVREGGFFRLQDDLARFSASLSDTRMNVGLSGEDIEHALHSMVGATGLRAAYVAMREVREAHPNCPDLRTAAYMVAVRRIASVMDHFTL